MESVHSSRLFVEGSRKAGSRTGLKDKEKIGTERTVGKTNSPNPVGFTRPIPTAGSRCVCTERRGPRMSFVLHCLISVAFSIAMPKYTERPFGSTGSRLLYRWQF